MLLFRLLLLAAIAFIGWRLHRLLKTWWARGSDEARQPHTEDMVECTHCAVHIPRSQALVADGRWYCCEAHQREATRNGPGHS